MSTQVFHFLLLPGFSFLGFASAIEPLRVANRFREHSFQWHIMSRDGGPVVASNGMSVNAQSALVDVARVDTVFIVAGFNPLDGYWDELGSWLRAAQGQGATLGALDTGAFILAQAHVIGQYPVTVHWEAYSAFAERYPKLSVTQELFEWSPRCITCAGGTAGIDLMLALIGKTFGRDLATSVSEQFVLSQIRSPSDHQRLETASRFGVHNPKVLQVIHAMQRSLEDPLSNAQLAALIGVTSRQLERLFRHHLDQTPSGLYLSFRLDRSRQLVQQTGMSVLAVGVACGFGSVAHFSRAYRQRFGLSPAKERLALRIATPKPGGID